MNRTTLRSFARLAAVAAIPRPPRPMTPSQWLAAVHAADAALSGDLRTSRVKQWLTGMGGSNAARRNVELRSVATGLHMLRQWREQQHRPPSFIDYATHRTWAVVGLPAVIDPEAHDLLRSILAPRPLHLRCFGMSCQWDHPLSEACRERRLVP